jgi:hypothetical protein
VISAFCGSIKSKHKLKRDNEAKKSFKVMTDEKILILFMLRDDTRTGAYGLTFCLYLILKYKFPLIFYFDAYISVDILLYYTFRS